MTSSMKQKIKVAVFGSTGMLGHQIVSDLRLNPVFDVIAFSRRPDSEYYFDASRDNLSNVNLVDVDYAINCAGIIWQAKNPDRRETFLVNSIFPRKLQDRCLTFGCKLIHVSTDCVFSGKFGTYTENDQPDSIDDYGLSKSLGEPDRTMVLRGSVIGREQGSQRSLLEWAVANRGKKINGYTNHLWNGVTSNEYTRICADIMTRSLFEYGVHHVFSSTVSKYQLLCHINEALDLDMTVAPVEANDVVNRTLSTVRPLCQQLMIPGIQSLLKTLAA